MQIVIDIPEETYNEVCWRGLRLCPRDNEELVNAIRSGTPQPKTGHWIDGVCSECGYIGDEEVFGGKFKYCPVCGAVMRGEE